MIYQDVCGIANQAYIKYKAYYDKNANASRLKEAEYVLQPKEDHQKFFLRTFGGLTLKF